MAIITDRDACLAVSGAGKRELTDRPLSQAMEQIMEEEAHYQFQVIDINRSLFFDTCPPKEVCLKNLSTITHRRDLFEFMVREYARQREWDEEETLAHTTGYLQKLEQKHARKEKIKRLFKR